MNLALARPGYFNEKRFEPSMQTNWINYDLLCRKLQKRNISIQTIGFMKTCGADRVMEVKGFDKIQPDLQTYRTKTQQMITASILHEANDGILEGAEALLMPFYTFFEERCYYYALVYLAAEAGIPVFLWDTDANFINQVSGSGAHFSIREARDKVFKDPVYVNPKKVAIDMIDDLNLTVLSPALCGPSYLTYFPFFHIFNRRLRYEPKAKQFDAVYAGSEYQRENLLLHYYDSDLYSVALCGKYSEKFRKEWSNQSVFQGHIQRMDVQHFLHRGKVCVHIARNIYNKIGHVTPRVYEVVDSGTLLLVDCDLNGGDCIVGKEYVVAEQKDIRKWTRLHPNDFAYHTEKQKNSEFIRNADVMNNADILCRLLKEKVAR